MPELSSRGDGQVRPGAMTTAMRAMGARARGPRWLRWALIRDGRIENETTQPPERALTVGGQGSIPGAGAARELLAFERGSWVLRAWPGLAGRTDQGLISELSSEGTRDVTLGETARARIELEDGWSLLVQIVDRPAERLEPQLPASLRGGFLRGADWRFTGFVVTSVMLHLGLIAFLMEADWPIESLVPERHAVVIYSQTDPPPVDDDTPEMDDGDGDELAEADVGEEGDEASDEASDVVDDRPRRAESPRRSSAPDAAPSIDADAIRRDVAEQLLIAGLAPGSANSAFDALRDGAATESSAAIFDTVEGAAIATSDVGVLRRRDGRAATAAATQGIGSLNRRQGESGNRRATDSLEEVVVEAPRGRRPILEPISVDGPPFNSRELIRILRGRMGAVRRCYENMLTHGDPDLAGRITLEMTVMPPGHVTGVRAVENTTGSDRLASCIVRAVRTVRVSRGAEAPAVVEFPVVLARQN